MSRYSDLLRAMRLKQSLGVEENCHDYRGSRRELRSRPLESYHSPLVKTLGETVKPFRRIVDEETGHVIYRRE